jgi:exopolysaccharide biosynthesis polyprenyl glycosylphosphotransferase
MPLKPVSSLMMLRPRERRALLLIVDIVMAIIALLIALAFWAQGDQWSSFSLDFLLATPGWFFLLPVLWLLLLSSLYQERRAADWSETLRVIAIAAVIALAFYSMVYFFNTPKSLPRRGVAAFIGSALILTIIWRFVYINVFTASQFLRRVLLVGGGETGQIIIKILKTLHPQPFVVVGIIDDDPAKIGTEIENYPVLGGSDKLLELIYNLDISDLIVAISGKMQGSMFQALLDAQEKGTEITRMPVLYEELLHRVPIRYLEADWILRSFVDQARVDMFTEMTKRLMDIILAIIGILMILPMLPFISLVIILDSGFPIFYLQKRMGRNGILYNIYKFRTMRQDAEANGQPQWAEENDSRTTRVGTILRKTHLDEFPQFMNVLKGEMSIVGPRAERPELVEWFQQHVPFYRARLLVRPGITGWAQVNQQYAATIDETIEKLEYDLYYIKHRSLGMDIRTMLRTPALILGFRGR